MKPRWTGWVPIAFFAGIIAAAACVGGCGASAQEAQEAVLDAKLAADGAQHAAALAACRKLKPVEAYRACADREDARYLDGGM